MLQGLEEHFNERFLKYGLEVITYREHLLTNNPLIELNDDGLDEREVAFLDVLYDMECKGNLRVAMDKVGYPKSFPVSAVSRKLGKHIKDRTKEFLVASSGQAAVGLVGVLIDPSAVGAKNIIAAAKDILDRAGVFKEEAPQQIEVRNMFILPAKEVDDDFLVIDHE
jgi:hypothetical protein